METEIHISKTVAQAMEWLRKMGIEVKPAIPSSEMYEFEYEGVLMMMFVALPNGQIQISCPFYLDDEKEEYKKQTFEIVKSIVKEDLKDYYIEYVGNGLAFIDQVWKRPQKSRVLRKYQLLQMLKEISDAYYTILAALALVAAPIEMWGLDCNDDNDIKNKIDK